MKNNIFMNFLKQKITCDLEIPKLSFLSLHLKSKDYKSKDQPLHIHTSKYLSIIYQETTVFSLQRNRTRIGGYLSKLLTKIIEDIYFQVNINILYISTCMALSP